MTTIWTQPVWVHPTGIPVATTEDALSFLETQWHRLPCVERRIAYSEVFKAASGLGSHEEARQRFAALFAAGPHR
ncbi:DUF982 domain-containing protein [Falsirhodobacter sp. 20TX0035]|uniref:DUF982 domain-containing protein n=1 Tax=Falsirhodobacter sp. 20TX0035 TaxID=3022019 RepID=UPI00232CA94D|nr:DUF982 domain-containing protein [Falsirhodobacter sp. 20TX0035]MDB6452584.1 DUF982 domain-containing protein [Falsirhodobacter sp. 20TX0035]